MAGTTPRRIDRRRIEELTEREEARLNERTPRSHTMYERAHNVLSGVASSYYNGNPLGMAAARASLTEILTPEAYAHLD